MEQCAVDCGGIKGRIPRENIRVKAGVQGEIISKDGDQGGSMGRHKSISHRAGVNFRLVLIIGFEFFDESIEGFGIVFADIKFNVRSKVLFEASQEGGIGDFGKAAEIPEFLREPEEKEQEGIRGDGKDFLKDKGGKESFKRVSAFSAKVLVKGVTENGRNEFLDIKIFLQELEERGGIIKKHVLTVRESIF
ncbi:MAG: hypothetical protein NC341_13365 [Blautia sp.]|nr:hypothetical protein [Blautia sp.]